MIPRIDLDQKASVRAPTTVQSVPMRSRIILIKQYGEAADIEAAMRADECLAAGDMEGEAVWLRIGKVVEEMQRTRPRRDEPTH